TLKELIRSLHLEQMVEFDNCDYPSDTIPDRIRDCHVGLVPLEVTSITNFAAPMKLFEYISLGLPVVSIRNDAISYYFTEDDCLFFQWNDPQSLSRVLDRLAENPELALRYRERSVAVRERFLWQGEKRKYAALLHNLAGVEV